MKMKKIGAVLVAAAFLFSASAGVADAAKGGARISVPKVSAPKVSAPKTSAPAAKKADKPNQEYAPSKKASDLKDKTPAAKANNSVANNAAAANTGTRWGNALRTMGLLAGGMMLGSMLGHLFGFGGGFLADALGVLFNVIFVVVAVKVIMMLVRRFFGKKNEQSGNSGYESYENSAPSYHQGSAVDNGPVVTDIRRDGDGLVNVSPVGKGIGIDYDPKSTADKYRRM
ncbi:hypothetical protein [Anaerovibrio sp.]|uniref:hypothetical protein n=1 Tax=Anaerovibrio sp. TaxID=1872532 RepID=UPI003F16FA75